MMDVASEQGYAGATVARVVERAGVSRRTFYELFVDREDCFLAGFDEGVARATRAVLDVYSPGAKWVERLRTALTASLSFLDAEPGVGQLLILGSLGAGHRALERRQSGIAQIITLVDEGRGESKAGAELPSLTAEGVVGGALSVVHSRLSAEKPAPLIGLVNQLMSMIVLPYLGPAAARKQLTRPVENTGARKAVAVRDPLKEAHMRLTYRTVTVLLAVGAHPGGSNKEVSEASGVGDQGQISKLLSRMEKLGLVSNTGEGSRQGAPNAWTLTKQGQEVHGALAPQG
jgi:AcrR family transcriptional regulator